jgi:hypothetical protein
LLAQLSNHPSTIFGHLKDTQLSPQAVDMVEPKPPVILIEGLADLQDLTIGRIEIEMCLDQVSWVYRECDSLISRISEGIPTDIMCVIKVLEKLPVKPAKGEAQKPDPITNHFDDLIQGLSSTLAALLAKPDLEQARNAFDLASLSAEQFLVEARKIAESPTIQDRGLTFLRGSTIHIERDCIVCESDHIKCLFDRDGTFSAQAKTALMRDLNLALGACAREFFQRLSNESDGYLCSKFDANHQAQEIPTPKILSQVIERYNSHQPMIGKGQRFGAGTEYFGVGIEETWAKNRLVSATNYIVVSDPNESVLRFIECHLGPRPSLDYLQLDITRCIELSAVKCLTLFNACTNTGWGLTVVGPGKIQAPKIS